MTLRFMLLTTLAFAGCKKVEPPTVNLAIDAVKFVAPDVTCTPEAQGVPGTPDTAWCRIPVAKDSKDTQPLYCRHGGGVMLDCKPYPPQPAKPQEPATAEKPPAPAAAAKGTK